MAITPEQFITRYPEFSDVDQDLIQEYLDDAEQDNPFSVWGDRQSRGIRLLAAHRLALRKRSQSTAGVTTGDVIGSISSLSVSQESQSLSFGSGGGGGSESGEGWESTLYGMEYAQLRRSLIVTGFRA